VTHPPEWLIGEPCPVCGSPDILECQLRIGADKIEMGWECGDCGHSVTWTARTDTDEGHVIERRIVEHMPLHAITSLYGERLAQKSGVRKIKIHDTRPTCGSLLAVLDIHPRVAMTILRESRIGLTMDVYTPGTGQNDPRRPQAAE
jgi:integrase